MGTQGPWPLLNIARVGHMIFLFILQELWRTKQPSKQEEVMGCGSCIGRCPACLSSLIFLFLSFISQAQPPPGPTRPRAVYLFPSLRSGNGDGAEGWEKPGSVCHLSIIQTFVPQMLGSTDVELQPYNPELSGLWATCVPMGMTGSGNSHLVSTCNKFPNKT